LVALTFFGIRLANRAPQKVARQEPTDLTTTLSNIELFSTSQALQRLSETEQGIDPDQTEEKLQ
jgi:succinate dehydrogenase/fumarate reductase flavoprotein subunit